MMENLRKFEGKNVRLTTVSGKLYTGYVGDYIFADENEPIQEESLILDNIPGKNNPMEFLASEIKYVEVE